MKNSHIYIDQIDIPFGVRDIPCMYHSRYEEEKGSKK